MIGFGSPREAALLGARRIAMTPGSVPRACDGGPPPMQADRIRLSDHIPLSAIRTKLVQVNTLQIDTPSICRKGRAGEAVAEDLDDRLFRRAGSPFNRNVALFPTQHDGRAGVTAAIAPKSRPRHTSQRNLVRTPRRHLVELLRPSVFLRKAASREGIEMHFGLYLKNKGIISAEQLVAALEVQLKTLVPIGQLALEEGILSARDIFNILHAQHEFPLERFGDLAVEMGLMTRDDVTRLLMIQADRKRPVAEILVTERVLSQQQVADELAAYRQSLLNPKRVTTTVAPPLRRIPGDRAACNGVAAV
jgi:hypothetical protein